MDIRLALMCGTDIPVPECQVEVHQPKIKEIALIGEKEFFSGAQILCVNKSLLVEDNETLLNNFQIFMQIINAKEMAEKKQDVLSVATLLFPKYKIYFTPRSFVIGDQLVDENNFEPLQNIMREVFCLNSQNNQQTFNPVNKKAKEIAEKLMRGRKRVAAQKGEDQASMLGQYLSVLTVGLNSMSLQDCMDLTIYQMFDLIERYSLFTNWDLDIKSRLAGAKADKPPENWMKNIH